MEKNLTKSSNLMLFRKPKRTPQKLTVQPILMTGVISAVVRPKDKIKSNLLANPKVRWNTKLVVRF